MVLAGAARSPGKVGLLPICILSLSIFSKDMSAGHALGDLRTVAVRRLSKAKKILVRSQLCFPMDCLTRAGFRVSISLSPHAASAGS